MEANTTLPGLFKAHPEDGRPWWKYPVVWMVVGGPLSVVLACLVTWYFIMQAPEQVLTRSEDEPNTDQMVRAKGVNYAPAEKARNHAATGVPVDDH